MENAEKLQNVSPETSETSDDVQNKAELNEGSEENEVKEEVEEPTEPTTEVEQPATDAGAETESIAQEIPAEATNVEATGLTEDVDTIAPIETEALPSDDIDVETPAVVSKVEAASDTSDEVESSEQESATHSTNVESSETPSIIEEAAVDSGTEEVSAEDTNATAAEETASQEEVEEAVDEESADDAEEEEHGEEFDFEHSDKTALLSFLRAEKNEEDFRRLDKILKAIKPRFDELYELEKNEALQRFVSEGNEADAFEYHSDEGDKEFITLYGQLKSRRNKHYKELQNQRDDNLKKKEHLLEQLRTIVDGEESVQSINSVKELQAEWKKIGPVPGAQNKTLWANYNALLDRYYDHRSIYFELKDLDRKKNMVLKEELCEKAEALASLEDLKSAIVQLNDLHDEYKHIGPVPQEEQEALWQRFKSASDAIYAKRKDYFDELKVEFEVNLVKKKELITEVESFLGFSSDRITEWNSKTKEILELQKKWEAIGGVPREKAKEINRGFWNTFKKFFSHKNQFFKELEGKREENLARKQELILQAEELKESTDWDSAAQKLKNLQGEWKEIGPVPEKVRKEVYAKFKEACDHFFNRRRDQNKEKFKEYDDNLALKVQICDQIEVISGQESINLDDVYDLIDNYTSIGFVSKNAIKKSKKRFDDVIGKLLSSEAIEEGDQAELKNHIEFGRLRNTPGGDRKIQRKENSIRRKITSLENDISTWNTNIEFFANSATADKLKADMQKKIESAEEELKSLRIQLKSM